MNNFMNSMNSIKMRKGEEMREGETRGEEMRPEKRRGDELI